MLKRNKEVIAAWVVLSLSIALFILSFFVQRNTVSTVGPGFMPRFVAILLFILGIFNLRDTLRAKRANKTEPAEQAIDNAAHSTKRSFKSVALDNLDWVSAFLIMVYVFSIDTLGFPLASILYMFFQMIVLSYGQKRNWILFIALSILIPVLIYFAFTRCFYLMLPAGILG